MKKTLQCALVAALLVGCSKSGVDVGDDPILGQSQIVNFSSDVSTRVDGASWELEDKIGIFATGSSQEYSTSNAGYQITAVVGGELSAIESETQIFYYGSEQVVDYTAYYPYDADLGGESVDVDLISGKNSDLMWASTPSKSNADVTFAFEHQLAMLEFAITYDAEEVSEVTLCGLNTKASFNLKSGEFFDVENVADITASKVSNDGSNYYFSSSVLLSDNILSDFTVVVKTSNGKSFAWRPNDVGSISWESGKSYTYNINLVSVAVELTDAGKTLTFNKANELTTKLSATVAPDSSVIDWSSSKESVATVDSDGLVTFVGAGETTITATSDNCIEAKTLTIKVYDFAISQENDMTAMVAGESLTLTTTATSNSSVVWSSSETNVTVTDGVVTPDASFTGDVTITATLDAEVSDTYVITVGEMTLSLDAETKSLIADGSSFTLTATTNSTKDIEWASSAESYATVSGSGATATVSAVAAGTSNITATIGSKVVTCTVTVGAATISVVDATISETDNYTFSATTNSSKDIVWSSASEDVAKIDPSTGVVTVVAAGTSVITAKIDGTEIYDTATLTVNAATPIVTLTTTSITSLTTGGTTQIDASVSPSRYTLTYTSNDSTIATVDASGLVTGVAEGATTITVSVAGQGTTYDQTVYVKVIYQKTSVTLKLADFANASLPANDDIWIITDSEATDFDDLHAALTAADEAGRKIEVEFPNLTSDLEKAAFYFTGYNNSLVSIRFDKVPEIGNNVFRNCTALTHVYLPSVTKLGNKIFWSDTIQYFEVATVEGVEIATISATTFTDALYIDKCTIRIGAYDSSKITVDADTATVTASNTTTQFAQVLIGAAE